MPETHCWSSLRNRRGFHKELLPAPAQLVHHPLPCRILLMGLPAHPSPGNPCQAFLQMHPLHSLFFFLYLFFPSVYFISEIHLEGPDRPNSPGQFRAHH